MLKYKISINEDAKDERRHKGFFTNTMLFECTPGGKMVRDYISREARKDGISVSYCANLDGIEYEIGIPVKRKDVFDEVRYSDLYVRYKI